MKDDRKSEMGRQIAQMSVIMRRVRAVADTNGLKIDFKEMVDGPETIDHLTETLNILRSNMQALETSLNELDRKLNGCETRTKGVLSADIQQDRAFLAMPGESPDGIRSRRCIELNVAYDQMQLGRL